LARRKRACIGNQHGNDRSFREGFAFNYDLAVDNLAFCNAHAEIVAPCPVKRRVERFRYGARFRPPKRLNVQPQAARANFFDFASPRCADWRLQRFLDRLPCIENCIFRCVVRPIDFMQMRSLPREGAFPRILIRHGLGIPKLCSDTDGARV